MKLGIFADSHYCKEEILCRTRRPLLSLKKIKEAMDFFSCEKIDYCICMGDLVDRCDTHEETVFCLNEVMNLIEGYKIPFLLVPGNHDYAMLSAEELSDKAGIRIPPYTVDTSSHLLIVLDANYRSDFRRFDVAGVDWKDSNVPPWQLMFLKETLMNATKSCIVLIHENLDDGVQVNHVVKNASEVRKVIEDSGKVALVIQGHYHRGADRMIGGTRYLTVPAMCEGEDNRFFVLDLSTLSIFEC